MNEISLYIKCDDLDIWHLKEHSFYNHNYYALPININGMNILYGESNDDTETCWSLGYFDENKNFEEVIYFEPTNCMANTEQINLMTASDENRWF